LFGSVSIGREVWNSSELPMLTDPNIIVIKSLPNKSDTAWTKRNK
jgi:hypothetical protein